LKRPKAGIDLDDTSWNFMRGMCAYHNREYGTTHEVRHFTSFALDETWGCTKEEVIHRVTRFAHSEEHMQISAVDGAVDSFALLSVTHDLIAITAREPKSAPHTLPLVELLFGDLFAEVHFLGHTKSKGEFCVEHDVAFIVDDALHNMHSVSEKGIPVYLMDRPWNQHDELPQNVVRVFHWEDVLRHVL
jgi:uncharacterized HAD superfamily protein